MSDRPSRCQRCSAPHDKIIPVTTNGKFYSVMTDGFNQSGQPVRVPGWFDRTGNRRTDMEAKIVKNVTTERSWLTKVGEGKIHMWLCSTCRAAYYEKKAKANAKQDATELMFDQAYIDDMDARGRAKKEANRKAKREMNIPVTGAYNGID